MLFVVVYTNVFIDINWYIIVVIFNILFFFRFNMIIIIGIHNFRFFFYNIINLNQFSSKQVS